MVVALAVMRQFGGGQDRSQKQPRASLARYQIGVFALPSNPRHRRQRLFHQRRSINKHFHLGAGLGNKTASQLFQSSFDHLMVILAARIYRDIPSRFLRQIIHRIMIRTVIHCADNGGLGVGPHICWGTPPWRGFIQPIHIALKAIGQEIIQPISGVIWQAGRTDCNRGKALIPCGGGKPIAQCIAA